MMNCEQFNARAEEDTPPACRNRSFDATVLVLILQVLINSSLTAFTQQGVTLSGYLEVKEFDAIGNLRTNHGSIDTFQISLDDRGRYSASLNPGKEPSTVLRLVFDGSDTFYVCDHIHETNVNKVANAYVSGGNYPYCPWEEQRRLNTLWMAYAAGNYIRSLHDPVMPIPWANPRRSLAGYGFRFEGDLRSAPPYTPNEVRFVRDSALDLSFEEEMRRPEFDIPSNDGRVKSAKEDLAFRKKWWADKTVAGELQNSRFTNWNGLELPLSFSFRAFYPFRKLLRREHQGIITNVSELVTNERFKLTATTWLRAEDSRFRKPELGINGINYGITNANMWESTNSKMLRAEFSAVQQGALAAGHYDAGTVRGKRIIMAGLILLVGFTLSVYLLRLSQTHNNEHKTKSK